jgi:uncharacterized sporulation protein YeaH/YhbH (DUF444 family)
MTADIISQHYPETEWNIYLIQFSDGDNWGEDNPTCIDLLQNQLIPAANQFSYVQVNTSYNSGDFQKLLKSTFENNQKLVMSDVTRREDIERSIRDILGKGN